MKLLVAGVALLMGIGLHAKEMTGFTDTSTRILKDGQTYFELGPGIWGPRWKWTGLRGTTRSSNGASVTRTVGKIGSATVTFDSKIAKTGPKQLTLTCRLSTTQDAGITIAILGLNLNKGLFNDKGRAIVTSASGKSTVKMPLARQGLGSSVSEVQFVDANGATTTLRFTPAVDIPTDRAARILLGSKQLTAASPKDVKIVMDLPDNVTYFASPADVPNEEGFDKWFVWRPRHDYDSPSVIDMSSWLEKPAGKHGRVMMKGDSLQYDGKPFKLWGLNICFASCAPDKKLADKRAKMYAKYGINAVRLHKYADGVGWSGIQGKDSYTTFDKAGLDRMDYFIAKLKEKGIYTKLSAHFGQMQLGPGDKATVPYLNEFGPFKGRVKRVKTPASAVHYSKEVQDVHIQHTLNLLKHKNPYTGMTYAEDPCIAYLEIINEQSILFHSSMTPLKASQTLRNKVGKAFAAWLKKKYGDNAGLVKAWGNRAINSFAYEGFGSVKESLDAGMVLPLGAPWYWDPDQLAGSQSFRKQRLLDSMVFLAKLQDDFYDRYVEAVRKAGYRGEVVSSNWQAGRAFSHFSNLYSDARIGTVDRHNYFGGMGKSMCQTAGSGCLSSGMQQVAGRPFMLSEWIHVKPNEFGVEGPAIIGAYGMGLQGWDVSYMFQNRDNAQFSDRIGRDQWDVTAPQVLGVFPAVARQVLRLDVTESDVVAPRNVHVPSLAEGKIGFDDKVVQAYDVKSFDSAKVSAKTLAVAKCVVDFTKSYEETGTFDLTPYRKDGKLISSTKELAWTEGGTPQSGFFTINTPGTQAVVGFAKGEKCRMADVQIAPDSKFAAIYVTAARRKATLKKAKSVLIVAVARARNSGSKVLNGSIMLNAGKAPIVMEPVAATITLKRNPSKVIALDHDGKVTNTTVPIRGTSFKIDGAKYKTLYYQVLY